MMLARTSGWVEKFVPTSHTLVRQIGTGRGTETWEAESAGRKVALKFVRYDRPAAASADLRGLQLVKPLFHPNLLKLDAVLVHPGCLVVSMELADFSLADLMTACREERLHRLPANMVCESLTPVAAALDFLNAHRHTAQGRVVGIQHTDVRPGNLLQIGETVKLSDFGRAVALPTPSVQHPRPGSAAYAAPEVFAGRLTDRTDQYALAICYCELRTGQRPFPDPSQITPAYMRPKPDLSMLSVGEGRVIARALAQSPQDRWPSCTEFMARLAEQAPPKTLPAAPAGPAAETVID
jgi:serine/threonine protein kinase, bacterial